MSGSSRRQAGTHPLPCEGGRPGHLRPPGEQPAWRCGHIAGHILQEQLGPAGGTSLDQTGLWTRAPHTGLGWTLDQALGGRESHVRTYSALAESAEVTAQAPPPQASTQSEWTLHMSSPWPLARRERAQADSLPASLPSLLPPCLPSFPPSLSLSGGNTIPLSSLGEPQQSPTHTQTDAPQHSRELQTHTHTWQSTH